jgi:hypothetical protein
VTALFESSLFGDCVAAVEEARTHGYSAEAAVQAALDHLVLADHAEAIVIASILAGLIATSLNPTVASTDLEQWVAAAAAVAARPVPS